MPYKLIQRLDQQLMIDVTIVGDSTSVRVKCYNEKNYSGIYQSQSNEAAESLYILNFTCEPEELFDAVEDGLRAWERSEVERQALERTRMQEVEEITRKTQAALDRIE